MNKDMWKKLWRFFGTVALILGGILLFIIGMIATRAFLGSDENLLSRYFVSIDYEEFLQGHNIELITSPGVNTHITVYVAESIQKHWKSDDLQFIVQDPSTSHQLVRLDLSRDDYWGKALQSKELSELVGVSFEWNVPAEIAIGSRLSGIFSGTIEYPVVEGAGFRTQIRKLNMPISIAIVSEAELVESIRSDFLNGAKILALMATPLLLIAMVSLYLTNPKRKAKSSQRR